MQHFEEKYTMNYLQINRKPGAAHVPRARKQVEQKTTEQTYWHLNGVSWRDCKHGESDPREERLQNTWKGLRGLWRTIGTWEDVKTRTWVRICKEISGHESNWCKSPQYKDSYVCRNNPSYQLLGRVQAVPVKIQLKTRGWQETALSNYTLYMQPNRKFFGIRIMVIQNHSGTHMLAKSTRFGIKLLRCCFPHPYDSATYRLILQDGSPSKATSTDLKTNSQQNQAKVWESIDITSCICTLNRFRLTLWQLLLLKKHTPSRWIYTSSFFL